VIDGPTQPEPDDRVRKRGAEPEANPAIQTQLQQYENAQNTVAPADYIWDRANSIITKLTDTTNTLNYYKKQIGNIDSHRRSFRT
jgi:P-type conjugative transfer protein TrbJ